LPVCVLNRVLVIEDEEDIRDLVGVILTGNGYEVFKASSGEEGLVSAVSHAPDLILLDMVMPGPSGLEMCRLLKNKKSTRDIPIIILTVLSREVDRGYAFEAGADGFLSKPFSIEALLCEVDKVLSASDQMVTLS